MITTTKKTLEIDLDSLNLYLLNHKGALTESMAMFLTDKEPELIDDNVFLHVLLQTDLSRGFWVNCYILRAKEPFKSVTQGEMMHILGTNDNLREALFATNLMQFKKDVE